jgi:hypothetical protein
MRHSTVIRRSLAMILPVAIAIACTDNHIAGVSGGGSSIGADGNPGSGTSGSGTNTQGSPTAADTFNLLIHVTIRPTTADTLHGTPVAGATATLTKTEWTFIHGNGGDTMSGHTVTVGRATTDANGDARFDKLPADLYRVIAAGPTGSGLDSGVATIELLHVANGVLPITLRRAP